MKSFFEWQSIRVWLGRDGANVFFAFRFVLMMIAAIPLGLILVSLVCYRIYSLIALEINYRQKYGADWRSEFEKYHGSLAHSHVQITVASISMLALAVVLFFAWKNFMPHKRRRHPSKRR